MNSLQPRPSAPVVHLLVAVHGILTDRADPTWPERLERWAAARWDNFAVLTDHYQAGPLPLWNCFVMNPAAARAIARTVETWIDDGRQENQQVRVHFVAHSNGCDIVRACACLLMARGYRVNSLLLFNAPLAIHVNKLGLEEPLEDGQLGRLVVYAASADDVLGRSRSWSDPVHSLGRLLRWPYGNLGRVGLASPSQWLQDSDTPITGNAATRMFRGWNHGDFFPATSSGRMSSTFAMIGRDLKTD